jgi:hypothetical protein
MNSMPAAMSIALAHQHHRDLLADAGQRRLAGAARRATAGHPALPSAPPCRWWAPVHGRSRRLRVWRGSHAGASA